MKDFEEGLALMNANEFARRTHGGMVGVNVDIPVPRWKRRPIADYPQREERRMDNGKDFLGRYGPWALVAGGSEGLGGAFAEELAGRGLNLILVARRPGTLEAAAEKLRADHGVQVRTLAADLAEADILRLLEDEAADREIGLIVCNAALAFTGRFLEADLATYRRMIEVNCMSTLTLVHHFSRKMAARGRGGIILMSSMAGFQGSPMVAVYGATKAFLLTLAEAVAEELRPSGVDVLACCPAVVRTPNFLSDGHDPNGPAPLSIEPSRVAREAVSGLGRKWIVVPGVPARLVRFLMARILPRKAVVSMTGRNTRAMYSRRG